METVNADSQKVDQLLKSARNAMQEGGRQASLLEVQNWLMEVGLLVIIIGVFVALLYRANRKN